MEELPSVWFHVCGLGIGGIDVLLGGLALVFSLGYLWFVILPRPKDVAR